MTKAEGKKQEYSGGIFEPAFVPTKTEGAKLAKIFGMFFLGCRSVT